MAYSDNLVPILEALNGLTEAEKMNISQAIFAETFGVPNIKETHATMQGVRNGSKVPILEASTNYGSFPFTDGTCTLPSCDISSDWSSMTWKIGEIGCEISLCLKDFSNEFMIFFNTYRKSNEADLDSAVVQFIVEKFQKNLMGAEVRVAYFGDTSSSDELINGFDGFLVQMDARAVEDVNRVIITQNATSTKLTGEQVYNYMREMYDLASNQAWFKPENCEYKIDNGDAIALAGYLNRAADTLTGDCSCIDPSKVVNPRVFQWDNLAFLGIKIVPMPFVEIQMSIVELYNSGTGDFTDRTRMVLGVKNNMLLGYEVEETLSKFKLGYDNRKDEIWIQGASLFGAGLPLDQFVYAGDAVQGS